MLREDQTEGEQPQGLPISAGEPVASAPRADVSPPRAAMRPAPVMGFGQFVALVAALMAVNALAVDSMLPALPTIARTLGITAGNEQQWIVTAYLLGFGAAQILYGTLADRFGRKRVLLVGLLIYAASSIVAAFSTSLEMLIVARTIQGIGSAATRVLAVAIVRDCYSGDQMARVMSLSFIVFLAVPILAPSLGQIIMLVGPWQWIFGGLAIFSLAVATWTMLRLPETLHPEDRIPISFGKVLSAYRITLTSRIGVGYMLGMTFMLGGLFGFINSAQQIFEDVFGVAKLFPALFALVAGCMAVSSFVNSRVVARLGARWVSHTALSLYLAAAVLHAAVALSGFETLWTFILFQASMMFCFGLCVSNFGSIAMGPLGHVAGTASSVQGFFTSSGGALLGFFVGQHFNGTVVPLTLGFAGYGVVALLMVFWAEKGRLFQRQEAAACGVVRRV